MGKQHNSNQSVVENLKQIFANTYVLYVKTQNFHWNVVDSRFRSLHKLFEEQYEDLAEAADLLAERIRVFNVPAPGSMRVFLELATLKESGEIEDGDLMLLELFQDHQELSRQLREGIALADDHDDPATADVYTERLRVHDKTGWMLRSHLLESGILAGSTAK
ncbi:MAG: DNA starvation/stationary phase protection protein [Parachlamydiales bacterium]